MPVAAVAIGVASLGFSVYQASEAKKQQKKAEEEAKNYKRQELENPLENLQVSTVGAEMQQRELNNQVASAVDALRAGGSRAVIGGVPNIYSQVLKQNQQIASDLDRQYTENQRLEAQGEVNRQNMQEQRERDDLLGIGAKINAYQNQYQQGLNNVAKSVANTTYAAVNTDWKAVGGGNSTVEPPNSTVEPPNIIANSVGADISRVQQSNVDSNIGYSNVGNNFTPRSSFEFGSADDYLNQYGIISRFSKKY